MFILKYIHQANVYGRSECLLWRGQNEIIIIIIIFFFFYTNPDKLVKQYKFSGM